MKELFLNYEDSLLMKEKGFDEECFGLYIAGKFKLFSDLSCDPTCNSDLNAPKRQDLYEEIAAPLYSQAIQWILKKAERKYPYLSVTIYSDRSGYWSLDGVRVFLTPDEIVFNSPSECIREGIKLI